MPMLSVPSCVRFVNWCCHLTRARHGRGIPNCGSVPACMEVEVGGCTMRDTGVHEVTPSDLHLSAGGEASGHLARGVSARKRLASAVAKRPLSGQAVRVGAWPALGKSHSQASSAAAARSDVCRVSTQDGERCRMCRFGSAWSSANQ